MTPRPTQYLSCKFVATGDGVVIGLTQFNHVTPRKAGPCLFKQIFGIALLMGTVKKKIGCLFKILNLFDFLLVAHHFKISVRDMYLRKF